MEKGNQISISSRSLLLLRWSIGVIYCWFGLLKFFQGYSPAEDMAIRTIYQLTAGFLPAPTSIYLLAFWETLLGVLLILGWQIRAVVIILFLHLLCTFTYFIFFPGIDFKMEPNGYTLVGQYIMKNIIILCAAWVLWQTAPGNKLQEACYSIE